MSGGSRPSNAGNEKSESHYQSSTLTPVPHVSSLPSTPRCRLSVPKCASLPHVTGAVFDKKLKAVTQGEGNFSGHSFRRTQGEGNFSGHSFRRTQGEGNFSGHSFRRGGSCWALSQNFPGEIIKIMGDWK